MESRKEKTEPAQKCPECSNQVKLKVENGGLVLYNLNGQPHECFKPKPIGQAILGHVVEGFTLKGRRATISLDGGMAFEVRALDYAPLFLRLINKDGGILEE